MKPWIYKGKEYTKADAEIEAFVYLIVGPEKTYIGKKNFWHTLKRPPKKGNKNKRHEIKETEWQSYCGSSEALLEDIKKFGEDKFHREILILCSKKCIASYFELYFQMQENVLFDTFSYNNIINIRLNGNIFLNHKDECRRILKELEAKNKF